MNRIIILLVILVLACTARAMKPLSENDLSNASIQLSLGINPDQINNKTEVWDDSEGLNKFYQTSSNLMSFHFEMNLFEDPNETSEMYATYKPFFSFLWLRSNNDIFNKAQLFLIDPITWKDNTSLFSQDDIYIKNQIYSNNSIISEDYNTMIGAEEINETKISTKATGTPFLIYSNNNTSSSNTPYTYRIMSGNIEMRNTYINNTNSSIQPGSRVDITPR